MDQYDDKIKTLSVLTTELAQILLPAKNRGKFEKEEDLISCIKKREALLK